MPHSIAFHAVNGIDLDDACGVGPSVTAASVTAATNAAL